MVPQQPELNPVSEQTVFLALDIEHSLEVDFDEHDGLVIWSELTPFGDDTVELEPVPFAGLIEEAIVSYRDDGDYRQLYCIAHELGRISENVRTVAHLMEDGSTTLDPSGLLSVDEEADYH